MLDMELFFLAAANGGSVSGSFNAFVQAAATVGAVLVGWLLSVLTERRAWRRRKVEQVRERQLTMAVETLSAIRNLLSLGERLRTSLKSLAQAADGSADSDTFRVMTSRVQEEIDELAVEIQRECSSFDSLIVSLRFFGFTQAGLERMERGLDSARQVREAGVSDDLLSRRADLVGNACSRLSDELDALVRNGPEYLRR